MEKTLVLVSGFPGAMGSLIAQAVEAAPDMDLVFQLLGGKGAEKIKFLEVSGRSVLCVPPGEHSEVLAKFPDAIVVDFAKPVSMENLRLYAVTNHFFVAGSAGIDVHEVRGFVEDSHVSAVVDVNMAIIPQLLICALQYLANTFPDALVGMKGYIRESHQKAKGSEPSATARRMEVLLQQLGVEFDRPIKANRENADPHARHELSVGSKGPPFNSLTIETHIEGRNPYIEGTLRAIRKLEQMRRKGHRGKVLSMADVLSAKKE